MRLIDADAFRKHCQNIVIEELDNPALISWAFAYDNMIDEINEQPTIDPVKHAEWKEDGCLYKCSNCGNTEEYYDMSYCPVCGARMDE